MYLHSNFDWEKKLSDPQRAVRSNFRHCLTQIVCTIGPRTNNVDTLVAMIQAGMSAARMNFSHGDLEFHSNVIDNVRAASSLCAVPCAIILDTKGPEIRTGMLDPKLLPEVSLVEGHTFTFTTDQHILGNERTASISYPKFPDSVNKGDTILVDDGLLSFEVNETTPTTVLTTIKNTGNLGSVKSVNIPSSTTIDIPSVTEKDVQDILFGVTKNVDFIAASFIRKPEDVITIRNIPGVREKKILIISKIENNEGLNNFQNILKETDAIMVARGDLGVEIPIEMIANAQKMLIKEANMAGKPVITATQMLESMITNPRPTRAEACDGTVPILSFSGNKGVVANAIFDGSDSVMLSGETAKGKYPVHAVRVMANICRETEKMLDFQGISSRTRKHVIKNLPVDQILVPEAIASSAVKICWELNASLLVVLSDTGATVRMVSKYRPHTPILCVTSTQKTTRQILLSRNTISRIVPTMTNTENILEDTLLWAKQQQLVQTGDKVVITMGLQEAQPGSTNMVRVAVVK